MTHPKPDEVLCHSLTAEMRQPEPTEGVIASLADPLLFKNRVKAPTQHVRLPQEASFRGDLQNDFWVGIVNRLVRDRAGGRVKNRRVGTLDRPL